MDTVLSYKTFSFNPKSFITTFNLNYPDYLKIDVDGVDNIILKSFGHNIKSIKSILIEVNDNFESQRNDIESFLNSNNFKLMKKEQSELIKNFPKLFIIVIIKFGLIMMKKRSKPFIGFWCQFLDQFAIHALCSTNYDWIALDMEHGVYNFKDISILSNVIKSYRKLPFVRLNVSNENNIQRSLDSGAEGLILPMIEDHNILNSLISKMKYPPHGTRSVGYSNSNDFGLHLKKYINDKFKPYLVIQIESLKGVQNLHNLINVKS